MEIANIDANVKEVLKIVKASSESRVVLAILKLAIELGSLVVPFHNIVPAI